MLNDFNSERKFSKARNVKNDDKSKKYIFRGERNAKVFDRLLFIH